MTKKLFYISLILLSLAQFSFAQKTVSPATKKLAAQLTTQTVALFPVQFFEDSFNQMNAEQAASMEKFLSTEFLEKMEKSNLPAEKKDALKPRIVEFTQKISQMMRDLVIKDFNVRSWANKSLAKHYAIIFTNTELQKLNTFFKSPNGKSFIKKFNQMVTSQMEGNAAEFSAEDEKAFEQLSRGISHKITVKFTDTLIKNTMDDISKYVDEWAVQSSKNMKKEMETGAIKKEMDKFMAENFTK